MFESRSTMNMNRAVQELERFYARTTAHAVSRRLRGVRSRHGGSDAGWRAGGQLRGNCRLPLLLEERVTRSDLPEPDDVAEPAVLHAARNHSEHRQHDRLDRGRVDSRVHREGAGERPEESCGKWVCEERVIAEWVLAGRKMDNPICVPGHKSIYMSRFKKGKTFHLVKKTPTRDEPIKYQFPGGFAMIADELIKNAEGTWIRINQQSLLQFNVTAEPPLYVCVILGENSVLFDKIYGNWCVC